MSFTKLVLVEDALKKDSVFMGSFRPDVYSFVCEPESELPRVSLFPNVTHIATAYHFQKVAPFYATHDKDSSFRTFSNTLINYIKALKEQNGSLTWDILTCGFQDPYVIEKLQEFEAETGIIVRYSIDDTGNAPQGDWVLESHNVDIKNFYFNANINAWEDTLTAWWFGYEESRLYDYYAKLTYANGSPTGNLERIHTQVDSTGKPLYVQYDDDYKNLRFDTPGSLKFAPDAGSNYGTSPSGTNYVGICTSQYACVALEPWGGALRATSFGHVSFGGTYGGSYGVADSTAQVVVSDVDVVVASRYAFCALKTDGSVIAWGYASFGGAISDEATRNAVMGVGGNPPADPVTKVFAKDDGFCAITQSGMIYAWGNTSYGGVIPAYISTAMQTRQAIMVYHNERHFLVLCSNGDCYFWGQTTNSGRSDVNGGGAIPNVSYVACSRYGFVTVDGDGNAIGEMFGSYYSSYNTTYLPNMTDMKMLWMLKGNYRAVWLKNDGTLHSTNIDMGLFNDLSPQLQSGENIVQYGFTFNVHYIVTDAGNVYFANAYLDGLNGDEFTGKVVSVFPGRNAYVRTTDQKIYQVFSTGSYPYYSGDWRAPAIYTADAGKEIAIHFGNWDNGNNSSWIYTDGSTGTASKYDKDKYAPSGRTVYITGGYSDYAFLQNDTDAIASFPNVAAGSSGGGGGGSAPVDITAEETALTSVGISEAQISTVSAVSFEEDDAELTETLVDPASLLGKTVSEKATIRRNTMAIVLKQNASRASFLTTPQKSGLSGLITKAQVKVVRQGVSVDLDAVVSDTVGLYAPLIEEGDAITFTTGLLSATATKNADGSVTMSGNATGTYAEGEKASLLGYDMVFGSVAVNQQTPQQIGTLIVSNDGTTLTYTPDGTTTNPTGMVYTYNSSFNAYANTDGAEVFMVFKNDTNNGNNLGANMSGGRFSALSKDPRDALEQVFFSTGERR